MNQYVCMGSRGPEEGEGEGAWHTIEKNALRDDGRLSSFNRFSEQECSIFLF